MFLVITNVFFCIISIMIVLSGLLSHYGPGHHDYTDTNMALSKVQPELLTFFWNKQIIIYLQRFHLEKWRYGQSSRNCRQSWKNRKTLWSWWSSRGIWWLSSASILFEDHWESKFVLGSFWWSLWCISLQNVIFCQVIIIMFCFVALWGSKLVISLPSLHINIPGRLRQSGPVWARVCEGRMSSEAVKEGVPAADVLPGELLIIHFFFLFIYLVSFLSSIISSCSST